MYYKDEGIILNSHQSTDADRIVDILLKHKGRESVVFKGIRKSKSTKLNSADMGNYVEIFVYRKNREQLPYIREIKVKNHFYNIKKDYKKFLYLNYISELFLNISHPEEENIRLFNFLLKVLIALSRISNTGLEMFKVFIELRLIQVTGIMPDLGICCKCHSCKEMLLFFQENNEIMCRDCAKDRDIHSIKIDNKVLEDVKKMNRLNIENIGDLKIHKRNIDILDTIFISIITVYINKELKSRKILKRMLHNLK